LLKIILRKFITLLSEISLKRAKIMSLSRLSMTFFSRVSSV